MTELALARGKAVADFPQRMGSPQLTKHHGHKPSLRAKAAGLPDQHLELGARKRFENLTKHATESIHVGPPFLWGGSTIKP